MEEQTQQVTKKMNTSTIEQVDVQQQNLSLVEKSLSIQKDRQEQKIKKNEIFKIAKENAEQIALNSLCFPENELIKYLNEAEESLGVRRIQWHLILRDEKDFIILKKVLKHQLGGTVILVKKNILNSDFQDSLRKNLLSISVKSIIKIQLQYNHSKNERS